MSVSNVNVTECNYSGLKIMLRIELMSTIIFICLLEQVKNTFKGYTYVKVINFRVNRETSSFCDNSTIMAKTGFLRVQILKIHECFVL